MTAWLFRTHMSEDLLKPMMKEEKDTCVCEQTYALRLSLPQPCFLRLPCMKQPNVSTCLRLSCLRTYSPPPPPPWCRSKGEVCGQPGVRDPHPQDHDAALYQPTAEAPAAHPVRAQRHGEVPPHHAPGGVPGGAERPRGHRQHRGHLQHAPPVMQSEPPNHNQWGGRGISQFSYC